ncbi:MAG: hypothetical protein ACRDQW_13545, partial [Haloechinothrix sp.]
MQPPHAIGIDRVGGGVVGPPVRLDDVQRRCGVGDARVRAPEPVVEPPQLDLAEVDTPAQVGVRPRPEHQLICARCLLSRQHRR